MKTTFLLILMNSGGVTTASEYIIGGLISLVLLGYLVFSLIKPEKF